MLAEDSDYIFLYTAPSKIPDAGIGVFAKQNLPDNMTLLEYRGSIYAGDAFDNWKFALSTIQLDNYVIVGKSLASVVNDCLDIKKTTSKENMVLHPNTSYNCVFTRLGNKIFVATCKPIEKGEELYASYGWEYWQERI